MKPKSPIEAYRFSSPIGVMAIAWSGNKILAIHLPEKSISQLLHSLARKLKAPSLRFTTSPPPFVMDMAGRLQEHLQGRPQRFPLRSLALESHSPFFRKVYESASKIPSGHVVTYAELAERSGSPKACRAVGQAMAKNPFPIVVPCHRVVSTGKSKSNLKLGGFSAHGGLATKTKILEIENFPPLSLHGHGHSSTNKS